MKSLSLLLLLITQLSEVHAQTLNEWIQQKETQKKYLVEQVAALKVYNESIVKGFAIAKEGLTLIGNIKKGDFKLHENYFNSFKIVNPPIKKDARVAAIIALQLQILEAYKNTYKQLKQSKQINSDEINYYYTVGMKLLGQCTDNLNMLFQLITDDHYQMKDDERLKRIEALYKDMQDKKVFLQYFNTNFQVLTLQRMHETRDIQTSKTIYDIK